MSDLFIQGIEILKKQKLFEKTIFLMITSDDRKWYHFTCDDIYNYTDKVIDMHILISDIEANYLRFSEILSKIA